MSYETYEVTVRDSGRQYWEQNGKLHRLDGPAIIFPSGYTVYYIEGQIHRLDGPARILANGTEQYFIHGKRLTKEEFEARIAKPCGVKTVTIDGVEYELKRKGG